MMTNARDGLKVYRYKTVNDDGKHLASLRERETIKFFSLIQMRRELSYKRRDAVYMHITNKVGKPAKSFFSSI